MNNNRAIARVSELGEFLEASREELRVLIAVTEDGTRGVAELAELCGISRARASAALSFWREAGAIAAASEAQSVTEEFEERLGRGEIAEEPAAKVARDIRDNSLAELLAECARLMKKTALSSSDAKKLTALFTQYSLSQEYIVTLAAYLAEKGKLTVTRLVDEALKLVYKEIDTAEALEEYVRERESESAIDKEFRRLLGIYNRALTDKEREYFKKWSTEYGYFTEIVGEAYDICVNATSKLSLPYMDKILTAWFEASCRTLSECRAKTEADRAAKNEARKEKARARQAEKKEAAKPRFGDFDVNDAFKKALERSYGNGEKS